MPNPIILLVGQQDINDDFKSGLNKSGDQWDIESVATGSEALTMLNKSHVTFVISEMTLSDMTGVKLMKQISEVSPGAIRFIFSANTDRDLVMKSLGVTHQYVTKPCKAEALGMMLRNSLGLRRLLSNETLHARIAKIGSLPSPPAIYNQLVSELQSETANMQKIANLIRHDVSITAKLLQMINSAFFGLPTHVESPLQAVNLLGLDTVKSLVLTAGVFSQFEDPCLPGFSIDKIYNHSIAVGTSARHFANAFGLERRQSEDALMAGMLHDIGKLVMLTEFKEELSQALKMAEKESIKFHEAERRILGVTHADIGAHLLSLWGLSDAILEAVALHASPAQAASPMVNILAAVHVANAIDHDQQNVTGDPLSTTADMDYLKNLGIAGQLPFLKTLCLAEAK